VLDKENENMILK